MGLLLTALAIAVRLVWVLVVPTRPVGDFAMYLESARYLVEHHALDPEFIYMPGYVFLVAGVYAFGGGLLAIKMIGVAAGGAGHGGGLRDGARRLRAGRRGRWRASSARSGRRGSPSPA